MVRLNIDWRSCTPGQRKLLQSTAWAVLLSGGYGSGKTTGLIRKALQLKAANGSVPGLIVSQTRQQLWSTVYRNLTSQLTAAMGRRRALQLCKVYDKSPGGECYMDFGDGAPIYLRSARNPDSMDGLDVGWACGDEPRYWPQRSREVFYSRVRVRCPLPQRVYSSTPDVGYLSNEFNTGKKGRELIVAPTRENAHNLEPNYIENLRLSYSKRMQKAVLDGYFVPWEGAVYEVLDPDFWGSPHVVGDFDPRDYLHCPIYLAVDPGYRKSAWIWIMEVEPCQYVVIDELVPDQWSDRACVEAVNARGWPIDEIWCDPAADSTQSALDIRTIDVLQAIRARKTPGVETNPIRLLWGYFRKITFGVERVRTMLGDPEIGLPIRLQFHERLRALEAGAERGIVKDMLAYTYPEIKTGGRSIHVPVKDNVTDHTNDALRYWACGMYLTNPRLYNMDPVIAQILADKHGGIREAA